MKPLLLFFLLVLSTVCHSDNKQPAYVVRDLAKPQCEIFDQFGEFNNAHDEILKDDYKFGIKVSSIKQSNYGPIFTVDVINRQDGTLVVTKNKETCESWVNGYLAIVSDYKAQIQNTESTGVYWAATREAVDAGSERCKKFSSNSLEEQRDKLVKKYGYEIFDVKIDQKDDGYRVFSAKRKERETNTEVNYSYFENKESCEKFQSKFFDAKSDKQASTEEGDFKNLNNEASILKNDKEQEELAKEFDSNNSYVLFGKDGVCIGHKDSVNQWWRGANTDRSATIVMPLDRMAAGKHGLRIVYKTNGILILVFEFKDDCELGIKMLSQIK